MKKVIYLLMIGLIFNSCQKFSSSYNTETPTETPIETPIKAKNISTNEFSEKFPKKYTFDNLFIEDYSYEPMLYKTYGRHSVQFNNKKLIVRNSFDEIAYSFNIDSIRFKQEEDEDVNYLLFLHNNKYKNIKMFLYTTWISKVVHITIYLNDNLKMCFEYIDRNTNKRNYIYKSITYYNIEKDLREELLDKDNE